MSLKKLTIPLLLVLLAVSMGTASAHKTVTTEDGLTKVTWGFLNEPATTFTKSGLDLILRDNATNGGIPGGVANLTGELRYGDEKIDLVLAPQHGREAEGRYTSQVITLARPGLYTLYLKGSINGSAIDMAIPGAHETHDISDTLFPKGAFDPYTPATGDTSALEGEIAALKARIAALEAKANTQASTPATVKPETSDTPAPGLVALLAGVAVAAVVLARRTR